jgi:hypothetical protein
MTTEAQLETLSLEWLQDAGWNHLDSSDMAPVARPVTWNSRTLRFERRAP